MRDDIAQEWDRAMAAARDVRAERAVLGGCLIRPEILGWLDLEPEAFWDSRHRAIWMAMRNRAGRGELVDEVTVASELCWTDAQRLYLAEVSLHVPTAENVASYADVLRDKLVTRRVLHLASTLPARVSDGIMGDELLHDVQLGLVELDGGPAGDEDNQLDMAREVRSALEFADRREREAGLVASVATGVGILDARIGGLPFGVPSVLGARPGCGKSSMALCIARAAAAQGVPPLIVTYEDRRDVWEQRMLSQESGVEVSRISARALSRVDVTAMTGVLSGASSSPPVRLDHGHGLPLNRLARLVRARVHRQGIRLVVVDYVQLIPRGPHEARLSREEHLESCMNGLADVCGTEGVSLLVVSQLNRGGEEEQRAPRLSDFRGSGSIEQVGKLVLALHPAASESEIEILVLKNHQGPPMRVIARWDRARCRIG